MNTNKFELTTTASIHLLSPIPFISDHSVVNNSNGAIWPSPLCQAITIQPSIQPSSFCQPSHQHDHSVANVSNGAIGPSPFSSPQSHSCLAIQWPLSSMGKFGQHHSAKPSPFSCHQSCSAITKPIGPSPFGQAICKAMTRCRNHFCESW